MDFILLDAKVNGQQSGFGNFSVAFDNGPQVPLPYVPPLPAIVTPPPGTQFLTITSTPLTSDYWLLSGQYAIRNDTLVAINTPDDFELPKSVTWQGGSAFWISVHLSPLRDATSTAIETLQSINPGNPQYYKPELWQLRGSQIPQDWQQNGSPASWEAKELSDCDLLGDPAFTANNQLFFEHYASIAPPGESVVFEVKNVNGPQTIAVSWPQAIPRSSFSTTIPFLVYFHHNIGQEQGEGIYNPANPLIGAYPFGFDYMYYGLWRYLFYASSPLTGDEAINSLKGLVYQMAASSKNAVIVVPCNRMGLSPEIGEMANPDWLQMILREIGASMLRRAGVYDTFPAPGRVAFASFSAGNGFVLNFLTQQRNHPFIQTVLKEVYMFDAGTDINAAWVDTAVNWAESGSPNDKMVRAYTQWPPANYDRIASGPAALVHSTPDGLRTAATLPKSVWQSAINTAGGKPIDPSRDPWPVHQLIASTMLTDALRRSGF